MLNDYPRCRLSSYMIRKPVAIGDKVPFFVLNDQYGDSFNIESVLGKKNLVIYFYPKDDTPGCTTEACSFRDTYEEFTELNAMVIGISGDDEESHRNFSIKHKLNFKLLSDYGDHIRKRFGVPGSLFGMIPGRVTYIIDKKGIVRHIFNSQVMPKKHISEALKILMDLS